jgi:hypothetical protein
VGRLQFRWVDSCLWAISVRGRTNASSSGVLRAYRKQNLLGAEESARCARQDSSEFEERRVRGGEKIRCAGSICEMESVGQSKSVDGHAETISAGQTEDRTRSRTTAADYRAPAESRHDHCHGACAAWRQGYSSLRCKGRRNNCLQLSRKNF